MNMAVCLVSEPSKQCYTVEEVSVCLNELMGFALDGKKTIARPEKPEILSINCVYAHLKWRLCFSFYAYLPS